tara:strand:+ start:1226 stop:1519 length:294 start_codon:yes stop_codon:yes gene_type:complete
LLNRYWSDLFNFQLKRTNNKSNAEEITIEYFSKAFEKINSYNEKYNFKTWLITISKNLDIDQIRKNKNRVNFNGTDQFDITMESSPSPEYNLINEQN